MVPERSCEAAGCAMLRPEKTIELRVRAAGTPFSEIRAGRTSTKCLSIYSDVRGGDSS